MSKPWAPAREPRLSVVIPVRNDAGNLARCLKALQEQPGAESMEIIVADNGSTDPSREVAGSLGATVLRIPDVRVSALRNEGMRLARAPLVAFIDADNEVTPGWLPAVFPHFADQRVAAVGCEYSSPAGGTWVQGVYDGFRNHPQVAAPVRWLATGNLVVRRVAAVEIDGFDETLETSEDFDFCNRLRLRGGQILADPNLASTHFGDPQTLSDLFRSELWRGRDTLRLGLRGVSSWSELPSIVFPIITLGSIAVAFITIVLAWPFGGYLLLWTAASIAMVLALASTRAIRMFARLPGRRFSRFPAVWTVALVYDLARAFAIVIRMPHRRATASRKRSQVAA
jgi:glycosyltransferase involved in cell wall biosynthesis